MASIVLAPAVSTVRSLHTSRSKQFTWQNKNASFRNNRQSINFSIGILIQFIGMFCLHFHNASYSTAYHYLRDVYLDYWIESNPLFVAVVLVPDWLLMTSFINYDAINCLIVHQPSEKKRWTRRQNVNSPCISWHGVCDRIEIDHLQVLSALSCLVVMLPDTAPSRQHSWCCIAPPTMTAQSVPWSIPISCCSQI